MNMFEKLPALVEDVADYHSFPVMERFLREVFQDENFYVKEAGYYNNGYVGVVYYGEQTEKVEKLFRFAKEQSSQWSMMTD